MSKSDKKEEEKPVSDEHEKKAPGKESVEDKLKSTEEKLLRTLAEMENQRRRFGKERDEAFEFGGFNFARESLAIIDNIDRAILSFRNDEKLKDNKDLDKIIEGIEIVVEFCIGCIALHWFALVWANYKEGNDVVRVDNSYEQSTLNLESIIHMSNRP